MLGHSPIQQLLEKFMGSIVNQLVSFFLLLNYFLLDNWQLITQSAFVVYFFLRTYSCIFHRQQPISLLNHEIKQSRRLLAFGITVYWQVFLIYQKERQVYFYNKMQATSAHPYYTRECIFSKGKQKHNIFKVARST